jgi:poly-gamma-glutamate capsule biosynthesis protein CapA/YwtB (metallophosphatase superfamily)
VTGDPDLERDRELAAMIADGFTLAAVGDCIVSHPIAPMLAREPGVAGVVDLLRGASLAFGNLETSIFDARRSAVAPRSVDDWALVAHPRAARDLATLGFGLMSRANNHAMDWGAEGLRETGRWLDEAGVTHAGAGATLAGARAARYRETPHGRVGLVSLVTRSHWDDDAALDQFGEVPGRTGVNALRLRQRISASPAVMESVREIARALYPDAAPGALAVPGRPEELALFASSFVPGGRTEVRYEPDLGDLAATLRSVRLGKQHADLLVVSAHVHEEGPDAATPPAFLVDFARAAIDAGADVVVGHGVHRLWPVEMYSGRPIFYGLGNFLFSDVQEPLTEGMHGSARELVRAAFDDPSAASDADVTALLIAQGWFDGSRFFASAVTRTRFEAGRTAEVALHPIDLGYRRRLLESGVPRLAEPEAAATTLKRLAEISEQFGTRIRIDGDVGVIAD